MSLKIVSTKRRKKELCKGNKLNMTMKRRRRKKKKTLCGY